jgi:hypothetical protein
MDVDRARNSAFGQKVLGEFKEEDAGFQKFLDSTGFDPRRDLREVFMVSDMGANRMENGLILARGIFNVSKIQAALRQEGKTSSLYKGVEIWIDGKADSTNQHAMALLNSSTAAFGNPDLVKGAVDRMSASSSGLSADFRGRITEWSGKADAWFVSPTALNELGIGKSGSNQVMPQNGFSTEAIKEASAGVKFGTDLFISGETLARSDKDAQAVADVLRFIASMIRLNAKPGMEAALRIADSLKVEVTGATTKFSLSIPEEEWGKMIDGKPNQKTARRKSAEVI